MLPGRTSFSLTLPFTFLTQVFVDRVAEGRDLSSKPPLKRFEAAVNETLGTSVTLDT